MSGWSLKEQRCSWLDRCVVSHWKTEGQMKNWEGWLELSLSQFFIRSGRLRWYGHVMRKGDEDWMKKCMKFRVEGRRPVGRPRKTWLESVEVDMAELEIDKEDVHDRSKWRRNVNVMKRKSNPIGKRTING